MFVINKDVLRFQVSVSISCFMDVCHSSGNLKKERWWRYDWEHHCRHLSEEFSALCFTQPVSVHNVVKQLSAWTILQHHVDFCVRLQNLQIKKTQTQVKVSGAWEFYLEEFADVLMTEHLHSSNFQPGEEIIFWDLVFRTSTLSLVSPPPTASCPLSWWPPSPQSTGGLQA